MGFSSNNAVDLSSSSTACDSSSPWFVTRKRQRQSCHEHTTNRMASWMILVVIVIGMLCLEEDETRSTSRRSRTFSIWGGCQAFITQSRSFSTINTRSGSSRTQPTTISNIQNRVLGRRTTWTFTLNVSSSSSSTTASKTATITKQEQQQPSSSSSSLGYVIGDTKGAALLLKELEISRGSNIILTNVNLRVEPNQRWAIVGPNGVGKSTLLGAITGTVDKDNGTAIVAPKTRVGFLKQTAVAGSQRTVYDEVASGMTEIAMARNQLVQAEQDVSSLEEETNVQNANDNNNNLERHSEALQKLADATNHFERVGGYRQEKMISEVLSGLGFSIPDDCERYCSEFSGGWQMRIALAKLLLSQPQLLLLDEPSNHLDSAARQWLANYLLNYPHSLILVSHDTMLLEKSNINNIADIAGKTLIPYVGCNYSKFLTEKEFRAKAAWTEYERNMEEAAKLQAFVDRFGASATKASQAQSRVKQIEKMKREGKLTPPPISVVETRRAPVLKLPSPPKVVGETLISLKDADIGFDSSNDEEGGEGTPAPLLTNIDLDIQRGMKLLLRGPNGAGKSTLMKALRGTLTLHKGVRDVNPSVRLGTFTQDLAQELDVTQMAVDLVLEYARSGKDGDISITNQDARTVMGMLGLSQDKSLRKVGDLSGGEKARVALSMFALKPSNVLLLDEPSNHLDVDCIQALGRALRDYDNEEKHKKHGAIVVISHDRQFCESIGTFTHVGTVQDGCLVLEQRSIQESDWTTYQLQGASTTTTTTTAEDDLSRNGNRGVNSKASMTPEQRKQLFNAPKRIKKLEAIIEKAEEKIQQIEQDMISNGNDVGKLMDLTKDKETQDEIVLEAMEEWEMLEELIQQYGGQ